MAESEVIHFPWRVQLRVHLMFPDQFSSEPVCLLPLNLPRQCEGPCPARCTACDSSSSKGDYQ
jgi:hypothetical protein